MLNLFKFFGKKEVQKSGANPRFLFHKTGFHGDKYLLRVVDVLSSKSDVFIETGSNIGTTLSYFSKRYPLKKCYSCEPDREAYDQALVNAGSGNVVLYNMTSQDFIEKVAKDHRGLFDQSALFWLDAHGYGFEWPLLEELQFVMKNFKKYYILIDDFLVPGIPEFGYDVYQDQVCSHDYVKDGLTEFKYFLYYPNYKEHTSDFHPLRGWGLISSENIDWTAEGIDFLKPANK